MSGPSVSELLDWFDRCEGLPTIRAAIGAVLRRAAEADRGTPEGMTPNEMRRQWPANVAYIEREAVAAWLASPETEDVVARAVAHHHHESDATHPDAEPHYCDPSCAAALIEAIRQEVTK